MQSDRLLFRKWAKNFHWFRLTSTDIHTDKLAYLIFYFLFFFFFLIFLTSLCSTHSTTSESRSPREIRTSDELCKIILQPIWKYHCLCSTKKNLWSAFPVLKILKSSGSKYCKIISLIWRIIQHYWWKLAKIWEMVSSRLSIRNSLLTVHEGTKWWC